MKTRTIAIAMLLITAVFLVTGCAPEPDQGQMKALPKYDTVEKVEKLSQDSIALQAEVVKHVMSSDDPSVEDEIEKDLSMAIEETEYYNIGQKAYTSKTVVKNNSTSGSATITISDGTHSIITYEDFMDSNKNHNTYDDKNFNDLDEKLKKEAVALRETYKEDLVTKTDMNASYEEKISNAKMAGYRVKNCNTTSIEPFSEYCEYTASIGNKKLHAILNPKGSIDEFFGIVCNAIQDNTPLVIEPGSLVVTVNDANVAIDLEGIDNEELKQMLMVFLTGYTLCESK